MWNKLWNFKKKQRGVHQEEHKFQQWPDFSRHWMLVRWGAAKGPCQLTHQCSAAIWFCWDCGRLSEMGNMSFVAVWHLLSETFLLPLRHLWIKSQHPCVVWYYLCYAGEETWTEADDAGCWRPDHNSLAVLLCRFPSLPQRQGCPFSLEGAKGSCIALIFQPFLLVFWAEWNCLDQWSKLASGILSN